MSPDQVISEFTALISPEMVPVVAAVYGICFALKRARFFDDRFIPIAALLLGIVFEAFLLIGFNRMLVVNAIIRGIVCGMAAVFVANIVKQARTPKEDGDYSEKN